MHDRGSLSTNATDAESQTVLVRTISGLNVLSKDSQEMLLVI